MGGRKAFFQAEDIIPEIENAGINISPVSKKHLQQVAVRPLHETHRDPNDRLIVAQAISDQIPRVSSDRKFTLHEP